MKKICKRSGKYFNSKSNRQKYCKTVLCGYCPLRESNNDSQLDLVGILEELSWEYEMADNNVFKLHKENLSNGLQDDTFWGTGNIVQDLRIKPRLREGHVRAKKTLIYNTIRQISTGLLVGKSEHRTNANQFSKSQFKYTDFFVNIETGQYTTTSIKIPYHLAIGLIQDIQ